MTASEPDLRALAAIVTAQREDLPAQGLPPSLLSDLMGQVRCDAVQFQGFDSGRQKATGSSRASRRTSRASLTPALERAHWQHLNWDSLPCSYPDRTGDLRSVVKIADFYSVRQWRSSGMYADVYRPGGHRARAPALPARTTRAEPPDPAGTVRLYLFRFWPGLFRRLTGPCSP